MTALGAAAITAQITAAAQNRPPRILLRSSWQTVNIGDIAHTPGVLQLLTEYLPEAEVTLWPSSVDNGVRELLLRNFPKLKIVQGAEVRQALQDNDFLLHGSGPSLVAAKHVEQWRNETGKPYGIFGITVSGFEEPVKTLLSNAKFVFFRDSVSLEKAKAAGVTCPIMEFGPDGAFAVKLSNDQAAEAYLQQHGLQQGKFLCCIPRLRYTPYWLIRNKPMTDEDHRKHARNEAMKVRDHAPILDAIHRVIRETDLKILLCPEDESQMAVGKEQLYDKLEADVRERVVWRDKYWITDEAISTYRKSAGLFGLEMHSPIMCIGNGIPAIVCRFDEQTSKGLMWRDIGLDKWLFDLDNPQDVERIVPAVLTMAKDPDRSKALAARGREAVVARQARTMAVLKETLQS